MNKAHKSVKEDERMNKRVINSEKASVYMFLTVFIMYTTVFMTKQCFNAAMAAIVNEGVMTKTQTGFIIMVFYAVYAPMQIVGGMAADRFDNSKLIMLGLLGAAWFSCLL